jgi:hypothetical protein
MALIKGMLIAFTQTVRNVAPTVVVFQYNPNEMTRTLRVERAASDAKQAPLAGSQRPAEEYSLALEFDATDALERGGPITLAMGMTPRLAALELLMQPVADEIAAMRIQGGMEVPAAKLPLVLFVWGPGRVTPVTLQSLQIQETAFDELLNPIHARVQLSFAVIREADVPKGETLLKGAASYYQALREVRAQLQVPQLPELMTVPQTFPDPLELIAEVGLGL